MAFCSVSSHTLQLLQSCGASRSRSPENELARMINPLLHGHAFSQQGSGSEDCASCRCEQGPPADISQRLAFHWHLQLSHSGPAYVAAQSSSSAAHHMYCWNGHLMSAFTSGSDIAGLKKARQHEGRVWLACSYCAARLDGVVTGTQRRRRKAPVVVPLKALSGAVFCHSCSVAYCAGCCNEICAKPHAAIEIALQHEETRPLRLEPGCDMRMPSPIASHKRLRNETSRPRDAEHESCVQHSVELSGGGC